MILSALFFNHLMITAQNRKETVNQKDIETPDSIVFARNLRAQALDSINIFRYQSAEILLRKAFGIAGRLGELKLANNIMNNLADVSKARRLLGWEPQVGLTEGVRNLVNWYLSERTWTSQVLTE